MKLGGFAALLLTLITCPGANAADAIQARRYVADIKHLTSKEFKGRASGSPELDKAARFLAKEFHKAGLRPLGGSYLQPFPVSEKSTMGPGNSLTYKLADKEATLKAGETFAPFSFSASGSAT